MVRGTSHQIALDFITADVAPVSDAPSRGIGSKAVGS